MALEDFAKAHLKVNSLTPEQSLAVRTALTYALADLAAHLDVVEGLSGDVSAQAFGSMTKSILLDAVKVFGESIST